jgi:hypothetical protein
MDPKTVWALIIATTEGDVEFHAFDTEAKAKAAHLQYMRDGLGHVGRTIPDDEDELYAAFAEWSDGYHSLVVLPADVK